MQRKRRKEKRACIYNNTNFKQGYHKQLTKLRTPGVTAMERLVAIKKCHWGFKPGTRVHQPNLPPTGSHMDKQVQVVLVKYFQPTHQINNVACKSTQTYKT
jgi:hypothetical protein